MRGYFGIGVESVSKIRNVGALMRTAHAFDASFVLTVTPAVSMSALKQTYTAETAKHVPFYVLEHLDDLNLPRGCQMVGVELVEDAVELPSFRHPERAVYILGPEGGSLSAETLAKCDHLVKIPTKFCINVSVAGAVILYDRMLSYGRFPNRPVIPGGPLEKIAKPVQGGRRRKPRNKAGQPSEAPTQSY